MQGASLVRCLAGVFGNDCGISRIGPGFACMQNVDAAHNQFREMGGQYAFSAGYGYRKRADSGQLATTNGSRPCVLSLAMRARSLCGEIGLQSRRQVSASTFRTASEYPANPLSAMIRLGAPPSDHGCD